MITYNCKAQESDRPTISKYVLIKVIYNIYCILLTQHIPAYFNFKKLHK